MKGSIIGLLLIFAFVFSWIYGVTCWQFFGASETTLPNQLRQLLTHTQNIRHIDLITIHLGKTLQRNMATLHTLNKIHYTLYQIFISPLTPLPIKTQLHLFLRQFRAAQDTLRMSLLLFLVSRSRHLCAKNNLQPCLTFPLEVRSRGNVHVIADLAKFKAIQHPLVNPKYLEIDPSILQSGYYLITAICKRIPLLLYPALAVLDRSFLEHNFGCLHLTFPSTSTTPPSLIIQSNLCSPLHLLRGET